MGNCCCQLSSPCDHTVDETRGLLNSDSKALGSVEGAEVQANSLPKEVAEDSKHEGEDDGPEVHTMLSDAVAISPEAHVESSYSSVIQSLHTETSHTEQTHQSASPESASVTKDVGITEDTREVCAKAPDTSPDAPTDTPPDAPTDTPPDTPPDAPPDTPPDTPLDAPTDTPPDTPLDAPPDAPPDSAEVPVEIRTETTEEIEAKMTDWLVNIDEDVITAAVVQVAPVEELISQEEPLETVPQVEGDTEQEGTQADTKKEETKPPAEGLVEDTTQTKESISEVSAADRHNAEELQTLTDVAKNADGAEMQVTDHRNAKPQVPSSDPTSETDVVGPADNAEDSHKDVMPSMMAEAMEDSLQSEDQGHSKQVSTPDIEFSNEATAHSTENGQADDLGDLREENTTNVTNVDATFMLTSLQESETSPEKCKKNVHIGSKSELLAGPSDNISSTTEQVDKPESRDTAADQEKITVAADKEQDVAGSALNGLGSSAPLQKPEFTETQSDPELNRERAGQSEALSLDEHVPEEEEPDAQPSEKGAEETTSVVQETVGKEDTESHKGQNEEIILTSSHAVEVAVIPLTESTSFTDKEQHDDELYQGAEEITKETVKEKRLDALLEFTIRGVEESCSLAAVVDILAYSEREWKGNTAKSALIRKGYSEISCSFSGLRRVRGDNYCALRATLYQVLANSEQTPNWLLQGDFTSLPEKLEAQEHLIGGWMFPLECRKAGEREDAVEKLKGYLELLQKKWQMAAEAKSLEEKQHLCERSFQGAEEEYGLLEALKLLMLARAVELHSQMQAGQDVPVFCWLLFARDTSENPRTFLTNHLSQVGFGGGVEQVEMFLLGYALQHTIQAFRLYKMDTEEFVMHYPDDHKQDWPCVSIITEDDRHYNIPVRKPVQHQSNNDINMLLPLMS